MAQDEFFMHHPDPTITRDKFLNVPGGDSWYNVVSDWQQDTSWDILNTWVQNTAWDILNEFDQDTAWDILNVFAQAIAWAILNEWSNDTSWHIHPAVINYIAQFLINQIRSQFEMSPLTSSFDVSPVGTNFTISSVIEDNVSLKPIDIDTCFVIVPVRYTFTLTNDMASNFKITRVLNNTWTP
jgi:hypothetical protein